MSCLNNVPEPGTILKRARIRQTDAQEVRALKCNEVFETAPELIDGIRTNPKAFRVAVFLRERLNSSMRVAVSILNPRRGTVRSGEALGASVCAGQRGR